MSDRVRRETHPKYKRAGMRDPRGSWQGRVTALAHVCGDTEARALLETQGSLHRGWAPTARVAPSPAGSLSSQSQRAGRKATVPMAGRIDPPSRPQGGEGVGRWHPRPVSQCGSLRPVTPRGRAPAHQELEVSGGGTSVRAQRGERQGAGPNPPRLLCSGVAEWCSALSEPFPPTIPRLS